MIGGALRIFHVAGGSQWAGGERLLLHMADHLDPGGVRTAMVLPEKGPLEDELRRRKIPFEVIPLKGNPLAGRAMARLFREWKPDLVQGHGPRANFYGRLAAGKIPFISTYHEPLFDRSFFSWTYNLADMLTAARSAAVVCAAECLREQFLRHRPSLWEKTHMIPHGVDLERFDARRRNREEARRALNLGERWTLALIGRLSRRKGHAVLLSALARIREVLPPFRVLFAGDGPLRGSLERMVRELDLRENVLFLGVRRDVPELLAASDVVVMPSLSEGFPSVLLESLAMGKTVIASRVGGVAELMPSGEEGYLVPPAQPEKLAEALLTVHWNKPDAYGRAETGRRRVQREYDIRKTTARWEGLYRQLSGDVLIK